MNTQIPPILSIMVACFMGLLIFNVLIIKLYALLNRRDQPAKSPDHQENAAPVYNYSTREPEPRIVTHSAAPAHSRGEMFRGLSRDSNIDDFEKRISEASEKFL